MALSGYLGSAGCDWLPGGYGGAGSDRPMFIGSRVRLVIIMFIFYKRCLCSISNNIVDCNSLNKIDIQCRIYIFYCFVPSGLFFLNLYIFKTIKEL